VSNLYSLGPVKINSGALAAAQSVKWDFGIGPEIVAGDGDPYPTLSSLGKRQPTCAINGLDLTGISTFGAQGIALTAFRTFFRKMVAGGTRVADATTSHIKLFGTAGMLYPRGVRGPYGKNLEGEWNIVPTNDGTHDIVQISTGSAVS